MVKILSCKHSLVKDSTGRPAVWNWIEFIYRFSKSQRQC